MAERQSSSSSVHRPITCKCGEDVVLLTSHSKSNPGRKFWRCPHWKVSVHAFFFFSFFDLCWLFIYCVLALNLLDGNGRKTIAANFLSGLPL